ncbi:DDE-type integrase/transposase/recombinase [Yersinia pseudotuberculosis]|uniref:DDE-type integrase/transposase/recombinase n=1 Tax=Yersinia pseudotuberculosis TaxID=633 RepID=UPI0005AD26CA|nr:DDE-type integrase/transposase/recombinase [Yersinia pseudotuberculosis]AJJ70057.1 DDE domain protein [Yersinia pseudotuberculosis]PSH11290.1 IS6 family transposase [Yersinia pseudotuberculosis]VEG86248.1 Uncharacterised protein [Yersinia pseudotuberculosis]
MNPFHGRHFQSEIILWAVRWYCKYGRALALLKREGKCPLSVEHHLNNVTECGHGKLKRIINPMLGFKSIKTAYATIKGIEVMHALRKGQAKPGYRSRPSSNCAPLASFFF